jgi:prophage regulatory protein
MRFLMSSSFQRLSTVKARTGLSRSTLYRRIAEGRFPSPVSLGGRSVGWLNTDIDAWIAEQMRLRDDDDVPH